MNESNVKPWSTLMKIVLPIFAAGGALVCVLSVITLFREERAEIAVITRVVSGAIWTVFMLCVRAHPEWQRYLEEKF